MTRTKRFLATAGLLLASGVVALLLVEGIVLLALGEQPKFPRHVVGAPFGVRINEPGAVYRHKSADMTVWFRINQQGMRADRDFALEKPPGVVRIVSLGDSFTAGYEVDVEDCFSSVLERELRARGMPSEVLNAGVSGYSNAEAFLYLKRRLLDFDPDLVMISFYPNDLVDNVRTGLFAWEDGRLVRRGDSYVPAGALGDFLNENPLFNFLSGYSNAFALVKERVTMLLKGEDLRANEDLRDASSVDSSPAAQPTRAAPSYYDHLAAAIFEAVYQELRPRGVGLVVHSLPGLAGKPPRHVEMFPLELFDVSRPGILFVSGRDYLEPYYDAEQLYWTRSDGHWTPFSHALAGRTLAERIVASGLLPTATAQTDR